jgi:hypothetical protein
MLNLGRRKDPGSEIRKKNHPRSRIRILGVKMHRFPDQDPQHCPHVSDIFIIKFLRC